MGSEISSMQSQQCTCISHKPNRFWKPVSAVGSHMKECIVGQQRSLSFLSFFSWCERALVAGNREMFLNTSCTLRVLYLIQWQPNLITWYHTPVVNEWEESRYERWQTSEILKKQQCCSLFWELPYKAKFFSVADKLWRNKLVQRFYWSARPKW